MLAVTTAGLRIALCAMKGCGKTRLDPIHQAAEWFVSSGTTELMLGLVAQRSQRPRGVASGFIARRTSAGMWQATPMRHGHPMDTEAVGWALIVSSATAAGATLWSRRRGWRGLRLMGAMAVAVVLGALLVILAGSVVEGID